MQIDGKRCHEVDSQIDEASIMVDRHLRFAREHTNQLIRPLVLPSESGEKFKNDQEQSDFIWK